MPVAAANLMDTDVRAVDSDREQKCYPGKYQVATF